MQEYYLINVPGKRGYSFMVRTELTDSDDIIQKALDLDLFDDVDDAEICNVSDADENDQKFFNDFYDLDE